MSCSLPHTDSEVEALVQKLIDEDNGRQNAILDLALQFENSYTAKDDLRKAYEKCNDISQESRALIDSFLKEGSDKDYELNLSISQESVGCSSSHANLYLTEKELYQLHLDEEALRETLEEQAMDAKAREEKIRQKQADDDEFFLTFGRDELRHLAKDEEALKEVLEEEAKREKENAIYNKKLEEYWKEEQAHDELFRMECGVKSDSEYETD
ncbi:hypothetical protein Tco_1113208 [Tanacetum coccineum]|uniref:Uncharacterized protein n=1 Tax=Tanacetum coccineum TaxID=301880 RepID=A0ABQ5IT19_9ASTR